METLSQIIIQFWTTFYQKSLKTGRITFFFFFWNRLGSIVLNVFHPKFLNILHSFYLPDSESVLEMR